MLEELRRAGAAVRYVTSRRRRARRPGAARGRLREGPGRLTSSSTTPASRRWRARTCSKRQRRASTLLRANLKGPYFLTQLVARWMVEQRRDDPGFAGCVVNVTSMSATVASVTRGEYCVSKAGLSMASRLFAVRLAELGIPVYEVRPGIVRTDMTAPVADRYDRLIAEGGVPQGRWGQPADVGRAVAALAAGELPYSTGAVILVDGGLTLPRL